jgi:hypothetical protein
MTSESPSLVARLEALRQQCTNVIAVSRDCAKSGVEDDSREACWWSSRAKAYQECADALDPILADLRRLQSQETKEEEAARVDSLRLFDLGDLPHPAPGDTSTPRGEWTELGTVPAEDGVTYKWPNAQQATARILALVTALAACEAREQQFKQALTSIANSSCCGSCQEAALVAKHALGAEMNPHDIGGELSLTGRLDHEAAAVIALVHQQQIMEQQIAELERRVSTLSGLVNR